MNNTALNLVHTLLSLLTGVYLCAAIYHLCIAARNRQKGLHLSFSVMCIMAAGYCLAAKAVYSSLSIPAFLYALRWQLLFGIVFMTCAVWFTVFFTNWPSRLPALLLSLAALGLIALNHFSSGGILVAQVQSFDRLILPWGETIAFPNTNLSLWAAALWTFSLAVYLFVIMGCRRLWQVGRRRAALVIAANVIFFLSAGLFDLAVDLRSLQFIYVAEFRFLLCVFAMFVYTYKHFSRSV